MPDTSYDALEDATPEELRDVIEEQRQRLAFQADVLLRLGVDPIDLLDAA